MKMVRKSNRRTRPATLFSFERVSHLFYPQEELDGPTSEQMEIEHIEAEGLYNFHSTRYNIFKEVLSSAKDHSQNYIRMAEWLFQQRGCRDISITEGAKPIPIIEAVRQGYKEPINELFNSELSIVKENVNISAEYLFPHSSLRN